MRGFAVYAAARDTVRLQDFEVDESGLRPDQVVVRTRYSLISPGTELDCISGREASWFHFPQQLGYCAAGEVVAVGGEVTRLRVGDPVLAPTPHASHSAVDEGSVRAVVPAGIELRTAVWAHLALISITALRASSAELGDDVAVVGQGLIGNLAAQLFRAQGCRVIGVDRLPARLGAARACGIGATVDSSSTEAVARVKELTGGRGAQVVVDATGSAAAVLQAADMVARGGQLILLGTPRGSYQADVVPLLRAVHRATPNITMRGAHGYSIPQEPDPWVKHSVARNAAIILDLMGRGALTVGPLLSAEVRPEAAPEAYRKLRDDPDQALGYIIAWG